MGLVVRKLAVVASFEPWEQAVLFANASGFVRSIRVDRGDRVKKGDLIAILDVQRTADRLAPAAQALAAAEDAFRIVGVRFRNGNAILVEVIAAQREVELARLNRVSAVVEHNNARARLRIVVGE